MTTYSDAWRAEVVALALSYGPGGDRRAGRETGIPARTIRNWVRLVRSGDERGEAIVSSDTREAVAERFWSVVSRGTARLEAALDDPKTPARDVARIVEVAAQQSALLTGGVTARTETVDGATAGSMDGRQWWENALGSPLSEEEVWFVRETFDGLEEWAHLALLRELRAARAEGRLPELVFPRARLIHVERLLLEPVAQLVPAPPDAPRLRLEAGTVVEVLR